MEERIEFVVTRRDILQMKAWMNPITIFMGKGLKTVGFTSPQPIGTITTWEDPQSGDIHVKQVINNEH